MAEGDESPKFKSRDSPNGNDSDTDEPVKLDLIDLNPDKKAISSPEPHALQPAGTPQNETGTLRRDENPFSFKHFLRSDLNYHNQGARPKVYCEGRPMADLNLHSPSLESKQPRITPEFSSALPDFVQDHLVIEQCYLSNPPSNNYNSEPNNLPDFTPNRNGRLNADCNRRENSGNNIPLDLPMRPQPDFPLDLPIGEPPTGSRSCPSSSEVGNSKSLPDFLADGAVRSQNNDVALAGQSPERDSDRLRQEVELVRRQLTEQIRRADYLSRELEIARNKEHEYTQNLAKALEQVEENLERSNKTAAKSENTIFKLRQEVKVLTNEVNTLRRQNQSLSGEGGATGGPSYNLPNDIQSQRLATELRMAANTAEHSLRQLLSGVDNLRMLASTVEGKSRIEPDYYSDTEDDTGPAL